MNKQTNKYFPPIAISLMLASVACTSEMGFQDSDPISQIKLEVIDGTLKVSDFETFEELIEEKNELEEVSFTNIAQVINSNSNILPNARISEAGMERLEEFEGSYLLELLDEDGFVIIDEFLFYLDFDNGLVAVTSNLDKKSELLDKNYADDEVLLFYFTDDVISLLESGASSTVDKGNINSRVAAGFEPNYENISDNCSWKKCDNNGHEEQVKYDPETEFEYRLEAKHVYQAAGIYFRLMSEAKHMKRSGKTFYSSEPTNITIRYNYQYNSKKKKIGRKSGQGESSQFTRDHNVFYYESSRGLHSFTLETQFKVFIGGDHGSGYLGWWELNLQRIRKS